MPSICRPADLRSPALLTAIQRALVAWLSSFWWSKSSGKMNSHALALPHSLLQAHNTQSCSQQRTLPSFGCTVTSAACSCCWPCRRFSELLCLQQLPVLALTRPSPSHHPTLPSEGWSGVFPLYAAGLAGAGSVGKGKVMCLGHTAGSAIPAVPLSISPLKAPLAPKLTAVIQRRCGVGRSRCSHLMCAKCQVNSWTRWSQRSFPI